MDRLERWVLQIADNDKTWIGLGWMRPRKESHVGFAYLLASSVFLGLPGIVIGAVSIYLVVGMLVPEVWLALWALVIGVEFVLHGLFGYYWNRRADMLISTELRS